MPDRLHREWERHRPAVFGAAYRILGSVADAEDVVQGVWLRASGAALEEGPLDPVVRELVKIRASQINGCAFCVDMHVLEARRQGESEQRITQLPTWRESPVYTEAERAALAYTDAATRLPEGGVSDPVWDAVTACFTPEETGALVALVAWINAMNRIAVPTRRQPPVR